MGTEFITYWSRPNQCYIFIRNDVGSNTETTLLDVNKVSCLEDCREYLEERISFFCEVNGIDFHTVWMGS